MMSELDSTVLAPYLGQHQLGGLDHNRLLTRSAARHSLDTGSLDTGGWLMAEVCAWKKKGKHETHHGLLTDNDFDLHHDDDNDDDDDNTMMII